MLCPERYERGAKKGQECTYEAIVEGPDGVVRCSMHDMTHRMKAYTDALKAEDKRIATPTNAGIIKP